MTFDKVKEIIMETLNCGEDKITLEASLMDDIGADSLDAAELSMALEEAFGITISDEALADFVTVKDIVDYIDENAK
ncbi:MAG: acyl carrier protein [Lachnospiraceae bacterium]|nr:acyl carrier protein [Lachnospiraceae bacterium]